MAIRLSLKMHARELLKRWLHSRTHAKEQKNKNKIFSGQNFVSVFYSIWQDVHWSSTICIHLESYLTSILCNWHIYHSVQTVQTLFGFGSKITRLQQYDKFQLADRMEDCLIDQSAVICVVFNSTWTFSWYNPLFYSGYADADQP